MTTRVGNFANKTRLETNYSRQDQNSSPKCVLSVEKVDIMDASVVAANICYRAKELTPGVYIGNYLIKFKDYTCPVNIINIIDKEIENRRS